MSKIIPKLKDWKSSLGQIFWQKRRFYDSFLIELESFLKPYFTIPKIIIRLNSGIFRVTTRVKVSNMTRNSFVDFSGLGLGSPI